jgi:hypothetical protein
MPKIRDLGISFIPATKRPAEGGYYAQCAPPTDDDCIPTDPVHTRPCVPTDDDCIPTDPTHPCHPTDEECRPTSHPHPPGCHATQDDQCCPTDGASKKYSDGSTGLPADAVMQLRQQLQSQIGAGLPG